MELPCLASSSSSGWGPWQMAGHWSLHGQRLKHLLLRLHVAICSVQYNPLCLLLTGIHVIAFGALQRDNP